MFKSCGAKTRAGTKCKKNALENGRCRLHGGLSPGGKQGNQNALKHGIYSAGLDEEELALWDTIELGKVDDELRLCRIRLRRALIAEQAVKESPDDHSVEMELSEHKIKDLMPAQDGDDKENESKPFQMEEIVKKRPDYRTIVDRLLGRIAQLEKVRKELTGGAIPPGGTGVLRVPAQQSTEEWKKGIQEHQTELKKRVSSS